MLALLTVGTALVLKTPAVPKPKLDAAAMRALPGDPSLVLHTSARLGDKKVTFMKACSKAIATTLSKPESYVSVCVHDEAAVIWAGEETPCALGVVCSIGSINQENNAALTAAISELIEPFGVSSDRIYLNFFDVPRENCGWSGRTFAG